jgi:ABC-type oligopeptide transport system substrate-binding subunit
MSPTAYKFRAPTRSRVEQDAHVETSTCVGTGIPARPSRAKLGPCMHQKNFLHTPTPPQSSWLVLALLFATFATTASAATRPHYGGTLRVLLQSAPETLDFPANPTPTSYWDAARTLSLIGDTLVKLDALDRPQPALAVVWQSDLSGRICLFTLRRGVKFHDGTVATPAAIAQILSALHPAWQVRAYPDSVSIESDLPGPSLLAELALPRNLLLKYNSNHLPVGTGPFVVAQWQPGKLLTLAANEESWAGRPFVDSIQLEFGRSLRDQSVAFELDKADLIESAPQNAAQRRGTSSSSSLPVELLALVFSKNSKAQDVHLREALALAIDRKPIQSVLLKGAGEPAASILPNWMTGYAAVFSAQPDPQRARALLAGTRQPALNLSYDPSDPPAQLIAERIALNAREVGITVQVSLSSPEDLRLVRAVLPSPDPAKSLEEASHQLGLAQPTTSASASSLHSLDDLYQSERALLDGYTIIPLFHLPVASSVSPRVRDWQPDRLGQWTGTESSLAEIWLSDRPREIALEVPRLRQEIRQDDQQEVPRELPVHNPPADAYTRTASR